MSAALSPAIGADLLDELGFLHVPGSPFDASPAYLFVAIRRRPTLRHFDPERVDFWMAHEGRGYRAALDWRTPPPANGVYSWGLIDIVDRLGVSNEYLSFGGSLAVDRIGHTKVAVFCSEAPILARGGHSQGWDPGADRLAAFFARLRAAAGDSRAFEARAAALSPVALYAAFVAHSVSRHRAGGLEPGAARVLSLMVREQRRLRAESAEATAAGVALAEELAAGG